MPIGATAEISQLTPLSSVDRPECLPTGMVSPCSRSIPSEILSPRGSSVEKYGDKTRRMAMMFGFKGWG